MSRPRSVRGPLIVSVAMAIALVVALAGVLWLRASRPSPGDYVDALALPDGVVAIRGERGGSHHYVELWERGALRWRGLVPTYDGRPGQIGVRVSEQAVSVRVRRGGKPAHFDLTRTQGRKLAFGELTPEAADAAFPPAQGPLPAGVERLPRAAGALAPQPYHVAAGVLWVVTPKAITGISVDTGATVATLR